MVYTEMPLRASWIQQATSLWGSRFLGLYMWDEPGGKQLDMDEQALIKSTANAPNYSAVEQQFLWYMNKGLDYASNYTTERGNVSLASFTSDYALYWFDYEAGYDAVFAEFGWNYSRTINVNLVRGAATVQNKEWGVMITWTYTHPPYIESGEQLYQDMKYAYDNGAKYIIVFDSNDNWTKGILQQEHLQAIQDFWNYAQTHPQQKDSPANRVAYVLPDTYAFGFRGPTDRIWGLFPADNVTNAICVDVDRVMQQYGDRLDIIYDDPAFPGYAQLYGQLIFWNGTTITQ
jgi:hypothetical protein